MVESMGGGIRIIRRPINKKIEGPVREELSFCGSRVFHPDGLVEVIQFEFTELDKKIFGITDCIPPKPPLNEDCGKPISETEENT